MKKIIALGAICIFLLTACGGGASLIGTWKFDDNSAKDLSEIEKSSMLTFHEDGKLTQTMAGETREAKWEWVEEGKSFKMGRGDKMEVAHVAELTGEKLVIYKEGSEDDKVTLLRQESPQ